MRKIFFFSLVLLLFFYSCKNKQTEKVAIEKSKDLKSFFIKKDNDGSIYKIFFRKIDSKYCTIDSIFLPKVNQTLDLSKKDIFFYTQVIETFPIYSYNDYNFDGYKDICIFNNNFKNPEKSKTDFYYLFDKNKQKYFIEKQLEYLDITSVCKKDKVIKTLQNEYEDLSIDRSNPKIIHSVLRTYKWVNKSLKEIESIEEKELSDNNYKIKTFNIEKNETKEFKSKRSIISDFQCK